MLRYLFGPIGRLYSGRGPILGTRRTPGRPLSSPANTRLGIRGGFCGLRESVRTWSKFVEIQCADLIHEGLWLGFNRLWSVERESRTRPPQHIFMGLYWNLGVSCWVQISGSMGLRFTKWKRCVWFLSPCTPPRRTAHAALPVWTIRSTSFGVRPHFRDTPDAWQTPTSYCQHKG